MYLRACLFISLLQILACTATDVEGQVSDSLRVTTNIPDFYIVRDNVVYVLVNATHPNGALVDGEVTVLLSMIIHNNSNYDEDKSIFDTAPILNKTANMVRGRAAVYFDITSFSYYFELQSDVPYYLRSAVIVKDRNSTAEGLGFDFSLVYLQRHFIQCASYRTCFTFKPNKPQKVVARITYLNAEPVGSHEQLAELTYTEVLKKTRNEDLINRADVIPRTSSNITLHFSSHVDRHGFANFNVTLPDLPDYPGYDHFFQLLMTYQKAQIHYTSIQLRAWKFEN